MYKIIGKKLEDSRTMAEMIMGKISKHLGISYQQYRKYELGENRIPLDKFILFCDAIDENCGNVLNNIKERINNG